MKDSRKWTVVTESSIQNFLKLECTFSGQSPIRPLNYIIFLKNIWFWTTQKKRSLIYPISILFCISPLIYWILLWPCYENRSFNSQIFFSCCTSHLFNDFFRVAAPLGLLLIPCSRTVLKLLQVGSWAVLLVTKNWGMFQLLVKFVKLESRTILCVSVVEPRFESVLWSNFWLHLSVKSSFSFQCLSLQTSQLLLQGKVGNYI